MAHEIEGNYAFFGSGRPAWHGLGTVLKDAPSIQEAWKMAYPHELFKLATQAVIVDSEGNKSTMDLEDNFAIIRDDGKEIGKVGKGFNLAQPYQVFSVFESMINSGLVELEAGGSLQEGKRMWALAKVKGSETEIVKGDPVKQYVLLYTGFDGSLSRGMTRTSTRVVCANTLAEARDNGVDFKVRNTSGADKRIENAANSIQAGLIQFNKSVEAYRYLATKKMNTQAQVKYIEDVILPEDMERKDIPTPTLTKVNTVIELLDTQRGLELVPAIRGTAWQAYNAVSEYVTHVHGRNDDTRLNGQWFGESANLNRKALEMAIAM